MGILTITNCILYVDIIAIFVGLVIPHKETSLCNREFLWLSDLTFGKLFFYTAHMLVLLFGQETHTFTYWGSVLNSSLLHKKLHRSFLLTATQVKQSTKNLPKSSCFLVILTHLNKTFYSYFLSSCFFFNLWKIHLSVSK